MQKEKSFFLITLCNPSSISSLLALPSPWRGAGGEALFPSLCDATPFILPRNVNGVTTSFDADYTVI